MTHLFDPITIHGLSLSNRLVMPPMATRMADENGLMTDEACEYYREHARYSKVGLIITEHSYVHPQGKAHAHQSSMASDDVIPSFRRLTDLIHQEGVKVFVQLSHAGSAAQFQTTGLPPVGPSPVPHPKHPEELPQEMTARQIHQVTDCFAQAALRAVEAGFDGVELHVAHGYLLNQFYSPLTNRRTDSYGPQSVENRTRFLREVVEAVRARTGDRFPIAVRLGGCDYQDGGSTVADCVEACQLLEACGTDLIHITGGMGSYVRPGHEEPGYFRDQSVPVKQAVSIPVLLTGGVTTLDQADALLAEGCADMIGVGRAMFKNPHWAD